MGSLNIVLNRFSYGVNIREVRNTCQQLYILHAQNQVRVNVDGTILRAMMTYITQRHNGSIRRVIGLQK